MISRSTARRGTGNGLLTASAVILFSVLLGGVAEAQGVTVLRGGTLLDVESGELKADTTIVVEGNRIRSVGSARIPRGANVVDVSGKYIVPGLWDKHLHYKDWFGEMLVTNGITSAFVQSGGGANWLHAQNEGVHKGKILGPRMFFRERSFDVFDSVEAARAAARKAIVELKPSFIKAYTGLTAEQLKAVAEEAHAAGLHIEGHLGISARDAIEAGIDGLTHASGIALSVVREEDLEKVPDMRVFDTGRRRVIFPEIETWNESKTGSPNPDLTEYWLFLEDPRRAMMFGMMDRDLAQELIDLMVAEDVFIESNLTYMFRHQHDRVEQYRMEDHLFLNRTELGYVPERIRVNVLDYTLLDWATEEELALMQKGYRNFQWFTKTFVDAGGKLLLGPDTTSLNHATMLPGITTIREMELLVDTGLTPLQAIQAGTIWPSQRLGKYDELGSVEEGKLADLLVLSGNPLEDITVYKDIEMVMQNGRFIDIGYHYDHRNPIPWPPGMQIEYPGFGPVSEIPAIISSLAPAVVAEGGGDVILTVKGGEFLSTSTIRFGDNLLETELVSGSEIRAIVPARLVQNVGSYPVTVIHRAPGAGATNTRYFIVKFR
ncbi:MAG: amidohydrolase family protein [Woeseiaceae bacterium]|nr:amidohydrolase family protein [Woeseiaceae bacterium]